jgi:replicative superfamily II helicase
MNDSRLQSVLRDLNVPAFIQRADNATLARMIACVPNEATEQPHPERLARYGAIYEQQGLKAFKQFIATRGNRSAKDDVQEAFKAAYTCWRTLVFLPGPSDHFPVNSVSPYGLTLFQTAQSDDLLEPELALAFHLSVTGLLSECTAETRLDLQKFSFPVPGALQNAQDAFASWHHMVAGHIFSAFVRLVRKDNGWEDIHLAIQSIQTLQRLQARYEDVYLQSLPGVEQQMLAAQELGCLYYLAQLIVLVGDYLKTGSPTYEQVSLRVHVCYEQASALLDGESTASLFPLVDLLWAGCLELLQNAIWTHVSRLDEHVQRYVQLLTSVARDQPIIELWPSQQEAFRRHLLDAYQRAILVEMPTSAGKTLLAKFAIVQTKALHPHGLVVYVVPTRALVNQVMCDLRMDFRQLLSVEQAIPVFELDPTEERLLKSRIDVLVTTPEKLDLLVRREHPIVHNIVLVVADEAHTINDEERGARLELLLGTIKRDFATARFLLLSPFLPNPQDLMQWLGKDQSLPSISIDWKPSRKLIGTVQCVKQADAWQLEFETIASAHAVDVPSGMKITIARSAQRVTSIYSLTKATIHALIPRGSILVLCKGPGTAAKRARQLANEQPLITSHALLDAVCHYVETEMGHDCELVTCLRHGTTYHHRGLSHEIRWLIEGLIRSGIVNIVCGTMTLAQGMNFPISTVIIETLGKGRSSHLSYQDFWNIAGRAGRTLIDTQGIVAFPAPDRTKHEKVSEFLKGEAQAIASQLAELIEQAEDMSTRFDLQSLREHPQLSPLLQFLAHAMRISGNGNLAIAVEDVLQDSLIYHQIKHQGQEASQRLLKICQSYLEQAQQHRDILTLADKTGFATPSVLALLAQKAQKRDLSTLTSWLPEHLFGEDLTPLIERIKIIARLPELDMEQSGERFDPQQVARILRDWVNGKTVEEMTDLYSTADTSDKSKRVADFSKYLLSILNRSAWGIAALQTVCLGVDEQMNWGEIGYVSSMIFFGVRQKEAVWLRMIGVPRIVAMSLARIWYQRVHKEPESYDMVRSWIANLSDEDWQQVIPARSPLTPNDMRQIWQILTGR